MKLSSKDFDHNEMMDSKFTCDGDDVSPHLKWENIPENTKSFALEVHDPDAPAGDWIHWFVCNIPKDKTELAQDETPPGDQIENDFGKESYGGPCPPSGKHRYFFKVYALDTDKLEGITKANFRKQVKSHAIESAEMIGLYRRK
jgi:Raf kinase inhibitor-like YbhB/YbcL family protein